LLGNFGLVIICHHRRFSHQDLRLIVPCCELYKHEKVLRGGNRQQAGGNRQQAAGSRQQAAGSKQQAAGSRQQAAGSRQQAADSRQQAADKKGQGSYQGHSPSYVFQKSFKLTCM
jgi:hypothetical protein